MMTRILSSFVLLAFALACGTVAAQDNSGQTQPEGSGDVVMFVFDGNQPVVGAKVTVDGKTVARTGEDGGVLIDIPAGRHDVRVVRNGETVVQLDLLTAVGEQIRIIAILQGDGDPRINISSTGTGPVLAVDTKKRGLLKGMITSASGEPIANARVRVPARGLAVRTNEQGRFKIELPPGDYSIEVSHPEYATQMLRNIRVIRGKAVSVNLALSAGGVKLEAYVVTGDYEEGSIAAGLARERESAQVVSVISATQMSRSGASTAAEAVQRVSGVVVEQDKFVVIRGAPYRYTLTLFNGLPLPSPDPVLQTVPLDLFPESILASIVVQKSYSADRPANFGAGLVLLNTVTTPDDPFLELEISTGFNTFSTFETGLTYNGGALDWIGGIGEQRELPDAVPPPGAGLGGPTSERRGEIGRSFNDLFLVQEFENLPPDLELEAAGGRSFHTEYGTFGFLAAASYSHQYRRVREHDIDYVTGQGGSLEPVTDFVERRTTSEVQLTGFLSLTADWGNHRITSNTFFIRNTTDRTQIAEGTTTVSQARFERRFLLVYNQRQLLLTQLLGEHEFEWFTFNWQAQIASTERNRPDRRDWSYYRPLGSGEPLLFFAENSLTRSYNTVEDQISSFGADITVPLPRFGVVKTEVSFGFDINNRERSSDTRRFTFTPADTAELDDRIELIINDLTIERGGSQNVNFRETTLATDSYEGIAETAGYFINTDTRVGDWLRVAAGVRLAKAEYKVTTAGETGGFDETFVLPALSVTTYLTDEMQLRASVSQSVSYPRLIELSDTTFFNPDTGEQFTGNPNLQPTKFTSYDLRWAWYPSAVEALTVGVFYKELTHPIEKQFQPIGGGSTFATLFVNSPSAEIFGVEIGGRMRLGWLGDALWLDQMYFRGNLTLVDSTVHVGKAGIATNSKRPLTGQADHVLNLQIGYDGRVHDFNLAFTRVGERLHRAGVQGRPDIYQQPANLLSFTYALQLGERLPFIGDLPLLGEGQFKLKGENLLGEETVFRQGGELQRRITYGTTISASLQWQFF